ncbi:MAG: hypothetical protein ACRD1X_14205 [Vicinamibacteria bacterium]
MEAMALVLLIVGVLVMGITGIWLLVKAFQTSILWGLGYLFVPFVSLIFVVMYWNDTKKPFLYMLGGLALFAVGMVLGGSGEMAGAVN